MRPRPSILGSTGVSITPIDNRRQQSLIIRHHLKAYKQQKTKKEDEFPNENK